MNPYLVSAGVLALIVGTVHSLLGERHIFRRMRTHGLVPTNGGQSLHTAHVRILWATWHIATAMGWGIGAILFWLALPSSVPAVRSALTISVIASMLISSALVLVGTRGRHLGWVGLLGVAVLTALGSYA